MEKLTRKQFNELASKAKNITINGEQRRDFQVHTKYFTTRRPNNELAYFDYAGTTFYSHDNRIIAEFSEFGGGKIEIILN